MAEATQAWTLFTKLAERHYREQSAQQEAEIRAALVAKVREAIEATPADWLPAGETIGDCYKFPFEAMAEAAVDALADFYREQLGTPTEKP